MKKLKYHAANFITHPNSPYSNFFNISQVGVANLAANISNVGCQLGKLRGIGPRIRDSFVPLFTKRKLSTYCT